MFSHFYLLVVVVCTQNPTPTRAEASDVATAIYDGADGIMLSAESAAGKFPLESVQMQQRIITSVENDPVSIKGRSCDVIGSSVSPLRGYCD